MCSIVEDLAWQLSLEIQSRDFNSFSLPELSFEPTHQLVPHQAEHCPMLLHSKRTINVPACSQYTSLWQRIRIKQHQLSLITIIWPVCPLRPCINSQRIYIYFVNMPTRDSYIGHSMGNSMWRLLIHGPGFRVTFGKIGAHISMVSICYNYLMFDQTGCPIE